jgi:CheY-like chemotaxis protein
MASFEEFTIMGARQVMSNVLDIKSPCSGTEGHLTRFPARAIRKYEVSYVLPLLEASMKPLVMFVDDDLMILASLQRQLARKLTAYDFVFCDSGSKALVEAAKRTPDVLFSDIRMPGMDGLALLSEFAKRHTATICFAMTGQFAATERVQIESLVRKVLSKPVDCALIGDLIKSVVPQPEYTLRGLR